MDIQEKIELHYKALAPIIDDLLSVSGNRRCELNFSGAKLIINPNSRETINDIINQECYPQPSFKGLQESDCKMNQFYETLESMAHLLTEKNKRYGNSALQPLSIFNKLNASDSIKIRLDDKLARVMNGKELRKNDVADLIGYLTLLCIANGWTNFDELID